jgi:hypothetical protein
VSVPQRAGSRPKWFSISVQRYSLKAALLSPRASLVKIGPIRHRIRQAGVGLFVVDADRIPSVENGTMLVVIIWR